jgi:glycosyltransferase involved in cell wall biosynthesis
VAVPALRREVVAVTRLRVCVVIPVRDESRSLAAVLRAIPAGLVEQVVVTDNGSTDDSAAVARAHGAEVVSEPEPGYGRACWAGVQRAFQLQPDVIVMLDAANKEDPSEMPLLLVPLIEDRADFVLGSRVRHAEQGALLPAQRFGNWLTTTLMARLYGVSVTDLAPFRAIRAPLLRRLDMRERTYGWPTEMIVKAARAGARIAEVDVSYRPRRTGRSKVSGSLKGSIRAGVVILVTAFKYGRWHPAS